MTVKETNRSDEVYKPDQSDEDKRDATASWNGYSYQGKITIITVLNIINEYSKSCPNVEALKSKFADWKVEIERKEDFAILEDNTYQSIHQVKAEQSTYFSRYKEAIEDLKNHKNTTQTQVEYVKFKVIDDTKLYLHLSVEVHWSDDSYQQQLIGIDLYKYQCTENMNNSVKLAYCGLASLDLLLKQEVQKFLKKYNDQDSGDESLIVHTLQLKSIIDDHINKRHIYKDDIEYTIDFSVFINGLLEDSKVFDKYRLIWEKKEHFASIINEYLLDNCNCINNVDCEHKQQTDKIKRLQGKINSLELDEHFVKFAKSISPDIKCSDSNEINKTEFQDLLHSKGMKLSFLHIVKEIDQDCKFKNHMIPYYNINNTAAYYMPTTIDSGSDLSKEICKYIIKNPFAIENLYEIDAFITRSITLDSILDEIPDINNIQLSTRENKKEQHKITRFKAISMIGIEELKKITEPKL